MIVIDLGCAQLGYDSVGSLISRFQPELLLGYDPWPEVDDSIYQRDGTTVVLRRMAAWVYTGTVGWVKDGWGSYTTEEDFSEASSVPCFDLATLIMALPDPIVLKLNVEGAEYPLLQWLVERRLDARLERCIVQWHAAERVKLSCPTEEFP